MAPNKFEKHIKKQLADREIRPSANAWEKLSEKLDSAPAHSNKRNYFWYGIAASFIIVLVTVFQFFGTDQDSQIITEKVVSIPKVTEEKTLPVVEEKNSKEVVVKQNTENKNLPKPYSVQPSESDIADLNSVTDSNKLLTEEKKNYRPKISKAVIDLKIEEVLLEIEGLKGKLAVSDAEIDSLLRLAQQELLIKPIYKNDTAINAEALLADVEHELDTSFRDQIFEALKESLTKARTAVANRNK